MNWSEHLFYDESSPSCLRWKDYFYPRKPDLAAGCLKANGYWEVELGGRKHKAHRVIWELFNGPISSEMQIDHRDMDPANNKIGNLRACTRAQNGANRKSYRGSSSRYKGVSWVKKTKCWIAYITTNRRLNRIGFFDDEVEAAIAYNNKAIELFGEFARLNQIPIDTQESLK